MKCRFISVALTAAALLLGASPSFALDNKAEATQGAGSNAKADPKGAKSEIGAGQKAAAAKVKLVDINSASKKELKTLRGISDADADKIIAGRPYLTKAELVTKDVISVGAYENLKRMVIAKQKRGVNARPAK